MTEGVNTGGVKRFDYSKFKTGKLDEKKKKEIAEAYEQYGIRKKREKRNKIILWIVIGLVILAGIWLIFLR